MIPIAPLFLAALVLFLVTPVPAQGLYNQGTLRTLYLTFASSNWQADLIASHANGQWVQGDLVVDGNLFQQVGVRMTGNDSFFGTASDKKSLAISMDAFLAGQELLGYDRLNLHNGFNDPTMMREVLGYDALREYMPAPKCNWVKVYLNNTYWGLYVNVQQIDKTMIKDWFRGNDGNRYLAEAPVPAGRGMSALQDLGSNLQSYKDAYDLKIDPATAIKPWEDVRTLCQVLNTSPQLAVDLPPVFDYDRALWYLAFFNLTANLEGYNPNGADYYLYHDEEHGLMTMLPWDMEGAFGASLGQTVQQAMDLSPFLSETKTSRPLVGKLWSIPEWRARYIHHMRTILAENLNWATLQPRINQHGQVISAALVADTKKLYSIQDALDNVTKAVAINSGTYATTVPGLEQFCAGRAAFLGNLAEFRAVAPKVDNLKVTPDNPMPNTAVVVTARVSGVAVGVVSLYYRSLGGFVATPMFDDGAHGDGAANDGVFGGSVPASVQAPGANVDYYVSAQAAVAAGSAVGYAPEHGQRQAETYITRWAVGTSPVCVNELMAKNTSTIQDPNGEFEDWVELYNGSAQAVSLAGMFLTDDITNPTRWQFPVGTTIPGQGTLLVWCDDDATQAGLHASFRLSASGEEVFLFDTDGKTILSRLRFGALDDDVSNGWLEDGKQTTLVAYRRFGAGGVGVGATPGKLNDPVQFQRDYWPLDYANHLMYVEWVGESRLGATNAIRILAGPPNQSALLMLATGPVAVVPIGGGLHFLVGGILVGPYVVPTDATGRGVVILNVPNDPNLVGVKVYMQAGGILNGAFALSNGAQTGVAQ